MTGDEESAGEPQSVARAALVEAAKGVDVAIGFDSVWVPCLGRNAVWRLDARTGEVEAIIPTGDESLAVASGADAVWVTNQAEGTVSRIDPRTNKVVNTIRLGFNPHGVVVAGDAVWVAVAQEPI